MNFGMVSYDDLMAADFNLKAAAKLHFKAGPVVQKIFIGLTKWTDEDIVGKETKQNKAKEQLRTYSKMFNAVELNATHYKVYDAAVIERWAANVETDFLFCPKMYNGITHRGKLLEKERQLQQFLESIAHLKDYLGPIWIQVPESFSVSRSGELFRFLHSLPKEGFRFFLELRHESWFMEAGMSTDLYKVLQELGIGMVITDTPGRRYMVKMEFPIPATFIRFVCRGDTSLDIYRIDQWKNQLLYLSKQGLSEVYFFLHIHDTDSLGIFSKKVQGKLGK